MALKELTAIVKNKQKLKPFYDTLLSKQNTINDIFNFIDLITNKKGLNDKKWAIRIKHNPYKYL